MKTSRTYPSSSTNRARQPLFRWAAVAWAAVIFAASSLPGSAVPGRFGYLAHFTEYGIFGGLLALALLRSGDRVGTGAIAVAVASAYAVTDELHQSFVPLRSVDPLDWLADSAGAALGVTVILLAGWIARERTRQ